MKHEQIEKVTIIVGPTASGKSALGVEIAEKFNGEIISADSRQVYRGMDIGTGKIKKNEMSGILHHLLDVADPMETYTAADFVRDGRAAIDVIRSRKKLPIIVGGTFFYIDALIGKVEAPDVKPNAELRERLQHMSTDALYTALLKQDERRAMDIDPFNKRRLIRALEIVEALGKVPKRKPELHYETLTIGIKIDKKTLAKNIHQRLHTRLKEGMIEEVEALYKQGVTYGRMEELGLEYRYISRYLKNEMSKEEMLSELETKSRQYAKRQMTWLKRDKDIKWFSPKDTKKIFTVIETFLNV